MGNRIKEPEHDLELELLLNTALAARHAANACAAAVQLYVRKQKGPSGQEQTSHPTFMAKMERAVHTAAEVENGTDDQGT